MCFQASRVSCFHQCQLELDLELLEELILTVHFITDGKSQMLLCVGKFLVQYRGGSEKPALFRILVTTSFLRQSKSVQMTHLV